MPRLILSILCALTLLAGCAAPSLKGQVQSFTAPEKWDAGSSVYMTSGSTLTDNSLEFKSYRELLGRKLTAEGFSLSPTLGGSDLVAVLTYNTDDGVTVSEVRDNGRFYPHAYFGSGSRSFFGATYYYPYPTRPAVVARDIYSRTVDLKLYRMTDWKAEDLKPLYEGRIVSRGSCPLLSQVMPELLDGLFKNFPQTTGEVIIETQGVCDPGNSK
ncbi:hypothetical protein [Sneathiella limimaris]|uniref:hypothetical protein n=1 Tax=Sneathiella limimaris TaxID=1964213 RepID=UPI00146CEFEE|nr:hypothetical protein [Sneathiella limimaris]